MTWALSIAKDAIADVVLVEEAARALKPGEVRLALRRFALTANNITYAAFGHAMRYWDFFPGADGRGRLPVWGFADIVESANDALETGERIYGYFPAGSELIVEAGRVDPAGFMAMEAHRSELAPAYNRYTRCAADIAYKPELEAMQMVLQPLFVTAFLLDDHLRTECDFNAGIVSLTSASSKTAIALAYLLAKHPIPGVSLDGMTSPGNVAFVEGLGLYDSVTPYDALDGLAQDKARLVVDFAGAADINRAIHTRLENQLAANIRVGGAHWKDSAPAQDLPGPKPRFFFAPDAARARIGEWGAAEFDRRYKESWAGFVDAAQAFFEPASVSAGAGALTTYQALVEGSADPRLAYCVE